MNAMMLNDIYDNCHDFENLEEYEIITLDNETDSKQIMKIILGDSTMDEEFEIKLKKKALLYSNLK